MDQNGFTPPTIVDLAEVAIQLGFHPLAQLLVDAAYAVANEDVKLDKMEAAFNDLRCALLVIRDPESCEVRGLIFGPCEGELSDRNAARGIVAEAERTLRLEIMAARQPIF